jgi:hypothetical protein
MDVAWRNLSIDRPYAEGNPQMYIGGGLLVVILLIIILILIFR